MPELPEVYHLAAQMNRELSGKKIISTEVRQEKCLNTDLDNFNRLVVGRDIARVTARGKWVFVSLTGASQLLISMGMGGEVLFHRAGEEHSHEVQALFGFDDGSCLTVWFSWFGYIHAVDAAGLSDHKLTANLGICPLSSEFTYERFAEMLGQRRGGIKAFLLDQHRIAGIGNVYVQDILFKARLHPNRRISGLTEEERRLLHQSIREHLGRAAELGGLVYESDFYGQPGRYTYDLVGHRPGQPCPVCGTEVREIRTGSTRSFICERCQPEHD